MRFLLDENFPKAAIAVLEAAGHDALDLRGTSDEGLADDQLFAKAQVLDAVLLTTDRDFFHTIPHLFEHHAGVVVIALRQPNRAAVLARLEWVLVHIATEDFRDRAFQFRDRTWLTYPPLGEGLKGHESDRRQ